MNHSFSDGPSADVASFFDCDNGKFTRADSTGSIAPSDWLPVSADDGLEPWFNSGRRGDRNDALRLAGRASAFKVQRPRSISPDRPPARPAESLNSCQTRA